MYNQIITKGQFLIANPSINEISFNKTVILVAEHSNSGTVGFIINRPFNYTVNEFIPSLSCDFRVYFGGPVENNSLYFIHSRPDLISNSIKINENIYWSGEYEDLKRACLLGIIKETEIIFLLGYAGWAKNQLEKEITHKSWSLDSSQINLFSNNKKDLWKEKITTIRKQSGLWINIPPDPSLN
jgi:putative transcriptional regulator